MRNRNIAVAVAALALLAGCERMTETAPEAPKERGLPIATKGGKPDPLAAIQRMHKVAGRWSSTEGVFAPGSRLRLTLDVSNDDRYALQVRGPAKGGGDEIDVETRGRVSWNAEGIMLGATDGETPRDPIRGFARFRASFPDDRTMRVTAGDKSYTLAYKGL